MLALSYGATNIQGKVKEHDRQSQRKRIVRGLVWKFWASVVLESVSEKKGKE